MDFRRIPKRTLSVQVPEELEQRIREQSGGLGKRSLAEVASEVLCLGLGEDPRKFGIEPRKDPQRRKVSRRAVSSPV